jgi:hypothetical protein
VQFVQQAWDFLCLDRLGEGVGTIKHRAAPQHIVGPLAEKPKSLARHHKTFSLRAFGAALRAADERREG